MALTDKQTKKINTIADLSPDARNANKGTQRGRGMVEASLREVGAGRSIVVDKAGRVIAGNKTLEAAADIGLEIQVVHSDGQKLFVVQRDDLDLSDDTGAARKLAYLDNRASETGLAWDAEVLLADMSAGVSFEGIFNQDELDALLAGLVDDEPVTDPGAQIDKADELRQKWGVELGQMWQLGDHRLICGDCTDAATVARLMGGEKADMVFTDPPYGVDYTGGRNPSNTPREKLQGDKTGDLYLPSLKSLKTICSDHAPMYIWFADRVGKPVYDAVEAIGYTVRAMIIWNKLDAHYGNFMAQYMQKHEPCLYIVNGNPDWSGPTNEVTVWDVKQPTVNEFHPTQKPLELACRAIGNHKAEIVVDFFLGSGTTLIACEQLGRKCRAVEISPAYVAVALQRWADATGRTPELVAS